MAGPLAGIRVLDMTMNVMGPYAAQILGDMGAEVTKLEPPEGDTLRGVGPARHAGMSSFFLALNRNKRSLVVDLKASGAAPVLRRLIAQADVLLTSFRPAAMQRLGADAASVAAFNPRLIHVSAFGYGQAGPYAAKPAYDDLIQTALGLPLLQGKGGPPEFIAATVVDRAVGLMAASAVGMALFHRERTGQGQAIEVPMFESMAEFFMGDHLSGLTFDPPLGGAGYARLIDPNRRPYRTTDGHIGVLVYNDKHWRRFFALIERPDLASDPRFDSMAHRSAHAGAVTALLTEVFASRSTAAWLEALDAADIPAMPLTRPDDLPADPHMQAVDFFPLFDHPSEGRLRGMAIPQRWSASQPEIRRHAPRLGEHSAEVLGELGFDPAEIAALLEARIVREAS
jgi:crotonobetainyl-CoA:carnitine CoA-transferase CaiB-like acyl-CoA transferase